MSLPFRPEELPGPTETAPPPPPPPAPAEVSRKTSEPLEDHEPEPDRPSSRGEIRSQRADPNGGGSCTYHAIYGRKGMGKTLLARALFRARTRAGGSGVFLDPKGENLDLGYPASSVARLWAHVRGRINVGRPFSVVLAPGRWETGTELEELWRLLWEIGDLLFVVDETQTWGSAEWIDPGFQKLVGLARSRRVDMVFTMQTPPMLHKQIRGNLDVVTSFRQPELDYAAQLNRKWFNLPDPGLLQRLPQFHYLRSQLDRDPEVTRGRIYPS